MELSRIFIEIQEKFGKDTEINFRVVCINGSYEVYTENKEEPVLRGCLYELEAEHIQMGLKSFMFSGVNLTQGKVKYIKVYDDIGDY